MEIRNTIKKRASVYFRVSTGEQHTENQEPDVHRLVAARGFVEVARYVESVSTRKDRPEFERMLDDARRGLFDVLVIWSLDRFGRDTIGNMLAVRDLDRLGVQLVSVKESWLDTTGPTRTLLVAIFSWVAEQERERRSERTKAGLARVRCNGSRSGRPIGVRLGSTPPAWHAFASYVPRGVASDQSRWLWAYPGRPYSGRSRRLEKVLPQSLVGTPGNKGLRPSKGGLPAIERL
jgi:putative DNA-invertase from lambdoid prophage Rac